METEIPRTANCRCTSAPGGPSQFSADFTSHRLSTDETLSPLKTEFETIMSAIQSLKGPTAPPAGDPARAEQPHGAPRLNGDQQTSLTAEEDGELVLTHE